MLKAKLGDDPNMLYEKGYYFIESKIQLKELL